MVSFSSMSGPRGPETLDPVERTQRFCHAPGLRDAAFGGERRVAVKNLADRAETGCAEMVAKWREDPHRRVRILKDPQVRGEERADQPPPDRALVISAVAMKLIAAIQARIRRIGWRERTQSMGGQQRARARFDDRALAVRAQRACRKRNRENLVGAQRRLVTM